MFEAKGMMAPPPCLGSGETPYRFAGGVALITAGAVFG